MPQICVIQRDVIYLSLDLQATERDRHNISMKIHVKTDVTTKIEKKNSITMSPNVIFLESNIGEKKDKIAS